MLSRVDLLQLSLVTAFERELDDAIWMGDEKGIVELMGRCDDSIHALSVRRLLDAANGGCLKALLQSNLDVLVFVTVTPALRIARQHGFINFERDVRERLWPNLREIDDVVSLLEGLDVQQRDAARLLLEHGFPINNNPRMSDGVIFVGDFSLTLLSKRKDSAVDLVRLFLEYGADAKLALDALHFACFYQHLDVARLLLEHGANVDDAGRDVANGRTPLLIAAEKGRLDVARLLLAHGAQVNRPSRTCKSTALHVACQMGRLDVARLLLEDYGADVAAVDFDGNTPLHLACDKGNLELVALLARHGADHTTTNKRKRTPFAEADPGGRLLAATAELLDTVANLRTEVAKLQRLVR